MFENDSREDGMLCLQDRQLEEGEMVKEDRWREIHRMHQAEHVPIAEIPRRLDLDRKTVRRCLSQGSWQPYHRPLRNDTHGWSTRSSRENARRRSTTQPVFSDRSSGSAVSPEATRR